MNEDEEWVAIRARVPVSVRDRIDALAADDDRDRPSMVRVLLREALAARDRATGSEPVLTASELNKAADSIATINGIPTQGDGIRNATGTA